VPGYELAPVLHVAEGYEYGESGQVAELPGRDDPPQVSIWHAQVASDLGEDRLRGVDAGDGDRADGGEQRPPADGEPHPLSFN
jgi:hypothetical protein